MILDSLNASVREEDVVLSLRVLAVAFLVVSEVDAVVVVVDLRKYIDHFAFGSLKVFVYLVTVLVVSRVVVLWLMVAAMMGLVVRRCRDGSDG